MGDSPFDMNRWMDGDAQADFARRARRRAFASGQLIYDQGEAGTEMYRVASGLVRLSSCQPDGREAVFLLFGEGDYFGVSSLIDGGSRPQTAACLTPVELDILSQREFEALRHHHASFTDAVLKLLAQQMRVVSRHYTRANVASIAARLSLRLIELAVPELTGSEQGMLAVRLPQAELSAMVGASRQSVNKELQILQRQGVIRIQKGAILLLDTAKLRERADHD